MTDKTAPALTKIEWYEVRMQGRLVRSIASTPHGRFGVEEKDGAWVVTTADPAPGIDGPFPDYEAAKGAIWDHLLRLVDRPPSAEDARIADLTAQLEAVRRQADDLRHAGQMLSNCCYNLSHNVGRVLEQTDVDAMRSSYKAWDAATRARKA